MTNVPDKLLRDLGIAPTELQPAEILLLKTLSHGVNVKQAAEILNWNYETVKDMTKSIRYKLRAKNTMHAVITAIRQGIIE